MTKVILVIVLVALLVVFAPLASIWALNALFPVLAIPYTLETWAASFIIGSVVSGNSALSFKSK